jgi:PAS domain S-box-containing protein
MQSPGSRFGNNIPLVRRLPVRLQPYVIALAGMALLMAASIIARQIFGSPLSPFVSVALVFAFFVLFLGSAWMGYGPGILVCLLMTVAPRLTVVRTARNRFDAIRLTLLVAISALVSYIGSIHRRRESDLRKEAEELERRVRERSEELLVLALERRQAEDRLRFVLDSADVGYWDYDVRRGATTRSPQHDRIFGYSQPLPHWDYRAFLRHVHPEDRDAVDRELRATMEHGKRSLEFRILWPDGSVHWLWASAQTHAGSTGEPAHISGVIIDVTARRSAEDALRDQAQLLDLAHDAILSMDRDARICFWNRGAEQTYGYSCKEALGAMVHDLLQTQFPEPLESIERKIAEDGHWEGELTHTRKDRSQLVVASRWAVRLGANGEKLGLLEINTDITDRRRMEEQFRHTQKLESLGVLAGGVAHDFNNLLTGILGNASLAIERLPQEHPNRLLIEEVMRAAERAADLTRQLLAYAGKGRFVMRNIDMAGLVREIGGLVQASIAKKAHLRFELDPVPPIFADPGQMQQIVMNLVINGAEAIGQEGGAVTVRTAAQLVDEQFIGTMSSGAEALRPGNYVMLEVHDTGCGMDDETIKKIFDPFFTTKFAGRGLGLSAVLGIVRAHLGALKVYSEPSHGTTFKLLFPVSEKEAVEKPVELPADLAGSSTVLVVDDEDVVRRTARGALESFGYRTIPAENGREALEIYKGERGIALVLLDLTMPVMSGEETLRQLQAVDPNVRVLLTSGYNEIEALQHFAGKGLAGFIQKPYTAEALALRVKEVLLNGAPKAVHESARPSAASGVII